jgi:transcriptional regulator with XRE-family HTH domain
VPETDAWSSRLTAVTAAAVRHWRKTRGLTTHELADRCAELGHPVSRSSLANLESSRGRPSISVAEVLVLAAALEVPPSALLVPVGTSEIEAVPGEPVTPLEAWRWLAGLHALPGTPPPAEARFFAASDPMVLLHQHDVQSQVVARRWGQGQRQGQVLIEIAELRRIRAELDKAGVAVPAVSAELGEALEHTTSPDPLRRPGGDLA